jgi:hypothetical protein
MSSSATQAIDVAPARRTHPGLALAAALLSLPGVTVAWDLPAGGFWIGIPLAIVAVVLGLAARRAGDRLHRDVDDRLAVQLARIEKTGGRRCATVDHVAPASAEPNTSPLVAPK